jgi:hypothetical protein
MRKSCHQIEVRDRDEELDRSLNDKGTEAKEKSEKIGFIEGVIQKKHNESIAFRK